VTATPLTFEILHRSIASRARLGRITTPHGSFDTPAFMPVGTQGTIKGMLPHMVAQLGAQIVLNNTYHLLLRPGPELIARMGGVHKFMNWGGPILTDSGGYQAFSLAIANKINDEGVTFKSHIDGKIIQLTPELAIRTQNLLGPDIMMAFDDCPPSAPPPDPAESVASGETSRRESQAPESTTDKQGDAWVDRRLAAAHKRDTKKGQYNHQQRLEQANERTVRWLERCKVAHQRPHDQALFGIVQGGTDLERRSWSAERITNIDLPGYAIGGVAVGESPDDIARIVRHTAPLLPDAKPRYLMGVGYERDIFVAVRSGVDMFDCTLPTRNGRNANAFTAAGQMRVRNAQYAEDPRPIEPPVDGRAGCDCHACDPARYGWDVPGPFSRATIRHLFMAGEMLGPILVSLHNLRHFQRFMADLRAAILTDDWDGVAARWPVLGSVR
jgi:queuine tRNA-ribosyltransferase